MYYQYIVVVSCVYHAVWLRKLLEELQQKHKETTRIFVDNKSLVDLAKNLVNHFIRKYICERKRSEVSLC